MNTYRIGATVDIGCERENQEDFVQFKELDDQNLLCIIADGTGSKKDHPQPAPIVTSDIVEHITREFETNKELFLRDPLFFLKDAFMCSNKLLGAMKMGNEEYYSGYAASVSAILLSNDYQMYVTHSGNTRIYIMRDGKLLQVTKDHTKAQELYESGQINRDVLHVHPDRLKMTSGIGVVIDPRIDVFSGRIKSTDLIVMTTDGVHYAIRDEFMANIVLESDSCQQASYNLVQAAKIEVKYPDNMSAMVIHGNPDVRG